jgi:hypothetical protein
MQMMNALGRPAIIVNLDPGNENVPYDPSVDIRLLVSVPVVMEELGLGINGALVYAVERGLCRVFLCETRLSRSFQVQYGIHSCKLGLARGQAQAFF